MPQMSLNMTLLPVKIYLLTVVSTASDKRKIATFLEIVASLLGCQNALDKNQELSKPNQEKTKHILSEIKKDYSNF